MIEGLSIAIEQVGRAVVVALSFLRRLPAHFVWMLQAPVRMWGRLQAWRHRLAVTLSGELTLSRISAGFALLCALASLLFMPTALVAVPLAIGVLVAGPRASVDPLPRRLSAVALVLGVLISGWLALLTRIAWGALTA